MNRMRFLLLFILLLSVYACKNSPTKSDPIPSIKDLFVNTNEIIGWTYSGTGWFAANLSDLTTYINGSAEIYRRHGFVEAANQLYQGKIDDMDRQLSVTIYNQGSENNARATYNDPDIGLGDATDWANGAGQKAHFIRYDGLSQALTFYRKSYFVYLVMNCDTDESLQIIKQFALKIDEKIQ